MSRRQTFIARNRSTLPTADEMVDNLLTTLAAATEDEEVEGRVWYLTARAHALQLAEEHGVTLEAAAGVIAALSPQVEWSRNLYGAGLVLSGEWFTEQSARFNLRAAAIRDGAAPLDQLRGRKTRAFYRNIIGELAPVTIDRHAIAILYGRPLSSSETKVLERAGGYVIAAAIYRSVARSLDLAPPQLQAITWLTWRRLKTAPLPTF